MQDVMDASSRHVLHSDMTRPETGTVRVTEFGNSTSLNPKPLKHDEDDIELLEEFLSPRKLRALTGIDDLDNVEFLEMQIDADGASLGNFGMYLPNLKHLKLSNSIIPNMRDLGTSLNNLEVLWMPRCCLDCLDGLVTMSSLKELYLAYNEVKDVSPCGMLECLEILDLEGNLIDDYKTIAYLTMCQNLKRLSLEGNPICLTEDTSTIAYRSQVIQALPQLVYLDDIPVEEDPVETEATDALNISSTATMEFDSHWDYINTLLKDTGLIAESDPSAEPFLPHLTEDSQSGGSPAAAFMPTPRLSSRGSSSAGRPCSTLRPNSSQKRLNSSRARIGTSKSLNSSTMIRPPSATSTTSVEEAAVECGTDESQLTAGHVVCGNISKALRVRRSVNSPGGPTRPISSIAGPTRDSHSSLPLTLRPFSANAKEALLTLHQKAANNPSFVYDAGDGSGSWMNTDEGEMSRRRVIEGSTPDSGLPTSSRSLGDEELDELVSELKHWRNNYEKSRSEIEASRAPQVLTISHDETLDAIESSEDEAVEADYLESTEVDGSFSVSAHQASFSVNSNSFSAMEEAGSSNRNPNRRLPNEEESTPGEVAGLYDSVSLTNKKFLNKHRPIPQITASESSVNSSRSSVHQHSDSSSISVRLKKLPILPSKPTILKPSTTP